MESSKPDKHSGDNHELGESWSAKDDVVGGIEVCLKEIHVLGTKVVGAAKLDWQGDLPKGWDALPGTIPKMETQHGQDRPL